MELFYKNLKKIARQLPKIFMTQKKVLLSDAAAQARGLAIDAIHSCSSGHLGLPLGCAEIGAVL